ncbi:circadian clock protein KaiC [Mucilaginibacter rubeus]|uniref:non-specific serine/threonine protein kinase n=1 Tax=Mucilaginibacter rubeus TaxID=2027860 RepID=A0AAE6JE61_9SPHI|nr:MULTISPECIES: circadian clock protein KaiC [Mucilaginibacter]QEM04049.1 circadian clock protein KaiC [Mucilaginibacter rubeus]QEM16651.1 circadian clock protein KaiC [Mucilaginibacter gossypii]QTE46874.1 circadian clock protein KaiC [Mucilaginibacter rubeus]QTE53472.1 circadian clock protein KaiC [Mucilaginibacter rubeus]QTE58558.1 circadian clock protein KaiC [Mucilaginibacter rubeus]
MTKLHKKQQLITFEQLPKTPTGITGLDEITGGGLPNGRPTLICGEAGCGKTLMSLEFIVRGATEFNEPGVFMAFEEKADELASNVASLGFDLIKLQDDKKLRLDHVHIDRSEIEETGEYDLEGLFIRLGFAIDSIGAKRVVLDTLENLFSGLSNQIILRAELRRLFTFLKEKGVTAIITGEKGDGSSLTRQGLEEYVSDCVILLDHRVINQISTRRLRVVKYRGTQHGTNEYPFLIDEDGISVLPVTSLRLEKEVSSERISSGIPSLDSMFGGKGFFQGSSILVSGTAGTGKTSIAASFANEVCGNKKRCLYFAFEEAPKQILRNMKSINLDLQKHIDNGLLEFHASRPTLYGIEMHLVAIYKIIKRFKPAAVILDPITNLITVGSVSEVKSMLIRLIDFLQDEQITVMFTALSLNTVVSEQTDEGVSSLVDTWLLVRDIESNGERNRGLYIMKSRGMSHSNQVREFTITDKGLNLVDVYLGPDGVLTGSAREAQKLREKAGVALREFAISRKDKEILRRRMMLESKIASLQAEFESTEEELNKIYLEEELKQDIIERNRQEITDIRRGNVDTLKSKSKSKK